MDKAENSAHGYTEESEVPMDKAMHSEFEGTGFIINDKPYLISKDKVKDGDTLHCVVFGPVSAYEEQTITFGDTGIVDLHYDRVKFPNGEEYVYWPSKFKKLVAAPDLLKENQSLRSELQKQKELNAELVGALELFFEKDRIPAVHGAMPVALRSFREKAESLIKKSKES